TVCRQALAQSLHFFQCEAACHATSCDIGHGRTVYALLEHLAPKCQQGEQASSSTTSTMTYHQTETSSRWSCTTLHLGVLHRTRYVQPQVSRTCSQHHPN